MVFGKMSEQIYVVCLFRDLLYLPADSDNQRHQPDVCFAIVWVVGLVEP